MTQRPRNATRLRTCAGLLVVLLPFIAERARAEDPFPLADRYRQDAPAPGDGDLFQCALNLKTGAQVNGVLSMPEYAELRAAALHILDSYPGHIVVAPGRSMIGVTAFLRELNPDIPVDFPLSGVGADFAPNWETWNKHCKRFLAPALDKHPAAPVLVIDRSSQGIAIKKTRDWVEAWAQQSGRNIAVKSLSFDRHPGVCEPRYDISDKPYLAQPQRYEVFAPYGQCVIASGMALPRVAPTPSGQLFRTALCTRLAVDKTTHDYCSSVNKSLRGRE